MSTGTALLAVLALVAVAAGARVHDRLVALRARVADAWARIDAELRRRHELVPTLAETARAHLRHETGTLLAVVAARNAADARRRAAGDASGLGELAAAEAALSGALGRLNVVMESYPALRADATFRELAADLRSTDERVGRARRAHAVAVMAYETARARPPGALVASLAGFARAVPFDIESPAHRDGVDVSFA